MANPNLILDDDDSPLVHAFHTRIQRSIVYIERTCLATGATVSGTGTVFGYQGNKQHGWLPCIASAGHVLRTTTASESRFRIQQFDWSNSSNPTSRSLEFETSGTDGRSPCAVTYIGPNKDILDIGLIRGPKACTDGSDFFPVGLDGVPSSGTMAIETDWNWSAEGTRVAWAGFPALAAQVAKRPQPCYFEGCVSALVLRDDYQLYLIDGHNTFGVSGGPVWAMSSQTNQARIIGVISGYTSRPDAPQLPGLVRVAPIQPLRSFLEKHWGATASSVSAG